MTTPKFPPPPRSAQNRSLFSFALATTKRPSASTTSALSRLSMVKPSLRVRWPDAAAERQPADAGTGNNPGGNRQAEGMRGMIHIAPDASAADAHGVRRRIHMHVLDAGKIDGQRIVGDAEAAGIVAAAANGDAQSAGSSEFHGRDHVRHVDALGDEPRLLVDHPVVDFAGVLVGAAAGLNQFSAKLGAELGDFVLGDH